MNTGQLTNQGKFIYPNAGATVVHPPVGASTVTGPGDKSDLVPAVAWAPEPKLEGEVVHNAREQYPHTNGNPKGDKPGGHIPEPGGSKPELASRQGGETKTRGSTAEEQRKGSIASKFYPNTPSLRNLASANT